MSLGFRPEVLSESEQKALMIGIRGFISTLVEDFDVLPIRESTSAASSQHGSPSPSARG